ncbi:MAG TPA: alpha/beta fold hydrolase [Candidatus Acidoferrales bacterium]
MRIRTISFALAALSSCSLAMAQAPAPSPAPPAAEQSEDTAAAAQKIIHQLVAGEFSKIEALYDDRMSSALPPGKLAESWPSLIQQEGAFESILDTQTIRVQGLEVVKLACKFANATLDATVAFDPDGKIAGLGFRPHQGDAEAPWTAPAYAKSANFTEISLSVVNGQFELPGTLTMPKGDGPFPVVVLVQGSGPHDQDETIGPNKGFKDLAWGLASRGVAVYRYTKRTEKYADKSSDDPVKLTVEDEVISDARTAVAMMAKQPKINPRQVFLLGHSLGAYLAPRIAEGDPQIAGIAILGANTKPIEQVIVEQIRYLSGKSTAPAEESAKQLAEVEAAAKQIESPELKPGDTVMLLGSQTYGAYWLDLREYDPVKTAAQLKIPILILQAGRDYQVTNANFEDWSKALAKHHNVTLKLLPDLNHLFMAGQGVSTPAEYAKPNHVSEEVVSVVAAWILPGENPGHLTQKP